MAAPLPLSFLAISQNIGSIDCSNIKNEIPQDIRSMTKQFLDSLAKFIRDAALAHAKRHAHRGVDAAATATSNPADASQATFGQVALRSSQPLPDVDSTRSETEAEIDVVVLHVQEIGGKKHNALFNEFLSQVIHEAYPSAGWCSGLLMQQQNCDSTFTAMGVVLFLSKRVVPIASVLSVKHRTYVAVTDDPISYAGSAGYLFLGGKFSNAEKSRKGYLLTSLRLGSTCINFVNLHLYHDADNATAAAESPSRYAPRRVEAFLEAMTEVVPLISPEDPLFIFGDFNTRLDARATLDYLTTRLNLQKDDIKMGKKEVTAPASFWEFFMSRDNHRELQQFDREPAMLMDSLAAQAELELCELPVHFPPTYMLDDTQHDGKFHDDYGHMESFAKKKLRPFKKERLPAWCDRIFLNAPAVELITGLQGSKQHRVKKQNSSAKLRGGSLNPSMSLPSSFARQSTAAPVNDGEDAECLYDSVSLECMDHEAVFLLF